MRQPKWMDTTSTTQLDRHLKKLELFNTPVHMRDERAGLKNSNTKKGQEPFVVPIQRNGNTYWPNKTGKEDDQSDVLIAPIQADEKVLQEAIRQSVISKQKDQIKEAQKTLKK